MSDKPPLDLLSTLRNILHVLQADPRNFRNFGVWWWRVKALLKTQYTRDNHSILGDYVDVEGLAMTPDLPVQEMLRAALAEYAQNARYNLLRAEVADLDGEAYTLVDDDSGL
ncbi:hypothetical protein [Nevskia sp.]|uniref:hypothetical protein n=1 Tax=Nevskia sp. TaxID=1929292 RepID=UPI0025EDF1B9|nr:hypothetical protein [Nevskia sp.]